MEQRFPEQLAQLSAELYQKASLAQLPFPQTSGVAAGIGQGLDRLHDKAAPALANTVPIATEAPIPPGSEALTLEGISEVLQQLGTKKQHYSADQPFGTTPLTPAVALANQTKTPLASKADDLVRQQLYDGRDNSPKDLRTFVRNIQACRQDFSGRLTGGEPADPFAHLLAGSLPKKSKLATPVIFDVEAIRRDFPILRERVHGKPLVWFDNAATTQKPQIVIDTLSRFYAHSNSNIHRGAHSLAARATDAYEQSRQKIQRYLHAGSPEEILFVRGTTEGINLVAQTYGRQLLSAGDEILLSDLEHHANIVPWQLAAKERGAIIRVIPITSKGEISLTEYEKLLGPKTRLVALTHASNSLGTILPIEEMIRLAKRYGAHVLVDGAQSVAHLPVNVQALDCDFFVFSGHKIFGPTGIGALYGRRELLERLPPWQGGGNMIEAVTFEKTTYNIVPAKFEAGTPNIADAIGLGAALDYVERIGLPQIAAHERRLLEYATEQLQRLNGLRIIGAAQEKVALISFVMKDHSVQEIASHLDGEGIAVRAGHHCAQPSLRRFGLEATVRPSLAFYNTFEEVDRLYEALKTI